MHTEPLIMFIVQVPVGVQRLKSVIFHYYKLSFVGQLLYKMHQSHALGNVFCIIKYIFLLFE